MGGAYGEWTYRAPPGSSCTSGGTALPPATPVGQICTMYTDFPLHENTPNPRIKLLKRRLRLENPLQTPPPLEAPAPEAPGGSLEAPRVLEPPKIWPETGRRRRPLEAPGGPWRPLEAPGGGPGGPWLEAPANPPVPARLSLRSKKTIFSRWELRA